MSHSIDTFIASVEVKYLIADRLTSTPDLPSSETAPQQEAAAGSVKAALHNQEERSILRLEACSGALRLVHVHDSRKGRSARFSCVLFGPNPRV